MTSALHAEFTVEVAAALRAATADVDAGRAPFGGTGDPSTDFAVRAAVRLIASAPEQFLTPPFAPIAPVAHYTDPDVRARSLALRARGLRGVASAFLHCNFDPGVEAAMAAAVGADTEVPVLDPGEAAAWEAERAAHLAHRVAWRNERAIETLIRAYRYALATAPAHQPIPQDVVTGPDGQDVALVA